MLIINTFRRQVVRWWLKLFEKRYQVCSTSNITLFDEVRERFERGSLSARAWERGYRYLHC